MSGRCPYCGSTDIADTTGGKCVCLDCEKFWVPKARKAWRKKKKSA